MEEQLETRTKLRSKSKVSKRTNVETSEVGSRPGSTVRYGRRSGGVIHIKSKAEKEKREDDEICRKHSHPIVGFIESSNEIVCERCIYKNMYKGPVVFAANVAKDIKKKFTAEYDQFHKLYKEFTTFQTEEVRERIQENITKFFNTFREKIDLLEGKAVDSIHNSTNLNDLINTLKKVTEKLEEDKILEKYEDSSTLLKSRVDEARYAYVCTRRENYRKVIEEIRDDNTTLQSNIDRVNRMIDSIFDVNQDPDRIENVLNSLASDMMLIDEQKPDFGYILKDGMSLAKALEKDYSVTKNTQYPHAAADYLSDQMNAFYFASNNFL